MALPDENLKEGVIASDPLEFELPESYVGEYEVNGPWTPSGPAYALTVVGIGDVVGAYYHEDDQHLITMTQYEVYAYGLIESLIRQGQIPTTETPSIKVIPLFKTCCDFKGQVVIGNLF